MENNNTTLHVSLGDLPISKSEVDTVLNKSDGVADKIIVSCRQTGKTVLNGLLFEEQLGQLHNSIISENTDDPFSREASTDMNELNKSTYILPELNTDNFKRLADRKIDRDYEYQEAKEKVSHWQVHEFRVPKDPLPVGKGIVASIMELSKYDSTIWARLDKLGYNTKNLKREMKIRRMSVRQFLGCNFPRPVLEKLYQMAIYNGFY